jgi:hypothetical protein
MNRLRFLPALIFLALTGCRDTGGKDVAVSSQPSAEGQSSDVHIGPSVLVSVGNDGQSGEMDADIDPANSSRIVACARLFHTRKYGYANAVFNSWDGGKTWTRTLDDARGRYVTDPTCLWGFGDTVYYASLVDEIGNRLKSSFDMYRSTDAGRSWKMIDSSRVVDRPFLTIDRSNGPHRGRIYLYYTGMFLRRIEGDSLSAKVKPPALDSLTFGAPARGLVTLDGALLVPFIAYVGTNYHDFSMLVTTSKDGGRTLGKPVVIGRGKHCFGYGGLPGSSIEQDRTNGPFRGRLYIAWRDSLENRCTLKTSFSNDGGRTWSSPLELAEEPLSLGETRAADQTQPVIAVNRNGVVGMSWYDTRVDSMRPHRAGKFGVARRFQQRIAFSYDGGQSFHRSVAVSAEIHDLARANPVFIEADVFRGNDSDVMDSANSGGAFAARIGLDYHVPGDMRAMVTDSTGAFLPFWFDNRTGAAQLYVARVDVRGSAHQHGDPTLDSLVDVTRHVELKFISTSYDQRARLLTLTAQLINRTDSVTVLGPLILRALSVEPVVGTATFTNAMNQRSNSGATWDFSRAIPPAGLAPGEASSGIPIIVRIDGFDPVRDPRGHGLTWIRLTSRVVGRTPSAR